MAENKFPLISICIPTYNKPTHVRRLLDSIKIQSYQNIEVLIADNSERDEINLLAEGYKKSFPCLVYKKNNPPVGMAENHNEVMKMAKGDWVKIMHSDDWFASAESLQIFAEASTTYEDAFFIFSGYTDIIPGERKLKANIATHKKISTLANDVHCLFNDNFIGHPSTVMHKNTKDVFYDPNLKWVVDIDFYIRFLLKYKKFHFIEHALINIGIDNLQESVSCHKNPVVEIPEYFYLLNKCTPEELNNINVFYAFWKLIKKFSVASANELRQAGYTGTIPPAIHYIIRFQKKIPRIILKQTPWSRWLMKRCFSSLKKQEALS